MDRQEFIEKIDGQIAYVKANGNRRLKVVREAIAALTDVRDGAERHDSGQALRGAREFLRVVESMGGIARARNVGPDGTTPVIIYGSDEAKQRHTYALGVVEVVKELAEETAKAAA